MTYTAQQVESALEEVEYQVESYYNKGEFYSQEFSWYDAEYHFDHFDGKIPTSVGDVLLVELGGTTDYDSSGSLFCVVKVQSTGQLFRKDGWYQSHCGSEWDGKFYEVQAKEKVITVYE